MQMLNREDQSGKSGKDFFMTFNDGIDNDVGYVPYMKTQKRQIPLEYELDKVAMV